MIVERWSLKRRVQRHWLLLRPAATGAWQWRRLPGDEQGDWPPPAHCLQDTVALIMPAAQCSHFQVPAPPGLKPHEWPMLLEDLLQQPAEAVQVSCLSRLAGHLELLVVERAQVQRWLSECEELGVSPDYLWAELQLLPTQAAGQALSWSRPEGRCLIRGADNDLQHWLVWPDVLGEPPENWRQPSEEMTGPWPSRWATLSRLPNLLVRSGARRPKTRRRASPFGKSLSRLAGVCGVLALCWGALMLGQFWQQVPVWKAQVEALTGPVDNARQAARVLSRLQSEQTDWRSRQQQVVELEQAMTLWLDSQKDWGVSGTYFDGRTLRLVLSGNASPPDTTHWQVMAKAAGAKVSVETNEKTSLLTLNFNLDGQP
ncbi:type II secretion system protein GspL [Pseudomonas lijiangensis]|uniref:Type II secretion system protein GspL n=1 Tax=Pseudomonas lijiangensis TaxID=2995658 RepID=A0ABX8HPD7_9PSED|nr:type II secretion system protein GspL [Pseudomonas lijiangensis]MBX8500402.1 type II secretion system protein GspL [Pseudomonas lijiangensis]MBX8505654.1 type II secretion system protein GspL [Pseudomonas lijiangensis]QWU82274.1 type II secretion system protein GspL [Pseudomonas lijiangensis]